MKGEMKMPTKGMFWKTKAIAGKKSGSKLLRTTLAKWRVNGSADEELADDEDEDFEASPSWLVVA